MSCGTVALHTLGCKLNFAETSSIGRRFEASGYHKVDFESVADVYVINSCSVTENADKECRSLIRSVNRRSPDAFVVIIGCYAQLRPDDIASIEGVDLVLGAAKKFRIVDYVNELRGKDQKAVFGCELQEADTFYSSWSAGDRTRAFLKVQDGCDYNCSFCTIPLARGFSRSDKIEGVLSQITELEKQGIKEIVLTGINLGDFGKGAHGGRRPGEQFVDLLRAIDNHPTAVRFRISSIEPNLLNDEIIELVASSDRIVPHFHIPLQSGSDRILGLMKRRYRSSLYRARVHKIRQVMPNACIGVDVITGFPAESEEDFQETYDFLSELPVSYFHVFTYSERENTEALSLTPVVPVHERKLRTKRLRMLSADKLAEFYTQSEGNTGLVLFEESVKDGMMYGYTGNYIRVALPYQPEYVNQLVSVKLGSIRTDGTVACYQLNKETATI